MKKILMLLFAAVALSLPSQAQVKFGLKGGLNLTNLSLSESIGNNLKSKEGFHIGPTVKIGLPVPGLSVDASALYDQRSAKVSVTRGVSGAEVESTLKSQSLQVPINIRYAVGLGSVANLFAFAGPQFGFNLGDKNKKILDDAANFETGLHAIRRLISAFDRWMFNRDVVAALRFAIHPAHTVRGSSELLYDLEAQQPEGGGVHRGIIDP